jgi:hypothetical protein
LTSLAEYFQEVQAPAKELVLIKDAGRFAAFTQPDRFVAELLAQVRPPCRHAPISPWAGPCTGCCGSRRH